MEGVGLTLETDSLAIHFQRFFFPYNESKRLQGVSFCLVSRLYSQKKVIWVSKWWPKKKLFFWVHYPFNPYLNDWSFLVRLLVLPSQKARWRLRYPPSHRFEVPRETSRTSAFIRSQQQSSISSPWHKKFSFHASLFLEPSFSNSNITLYFYQAQPKYRESDEIKQWAFPRDSTT